MKKIIVIGCPGSGKSTFSQQLHTKTSIPLFHLDMLYWNADKTTVEKPVFIERLCDVMKNENWIIDGNYLSTLEMRLNQCDTVFFLDYPLYVCLSGIEKRRGKPRPDMPWIETEEDAEFTTFIKNFETQSKPQILLSLEKYKDKNIVIFKSRTEEDNFLRNYND